MRILILGGTGFIGPCYVRAAVERGHRVSVFNRGRREAELPPSVERLIGDRSGEMKSIERRDWDAVIDLATFVPDRVRSLGAALKDRVRHYTFISTVAVYEAPVGGETLSETSRIRTDEWRSDPYALTGPKNVSEYGALKALCEREAERQFPGRTLILRPGHIVGPHEPGAHLTYWPARVAQDGEVLVAGDPWTRIQFIDARDLAEWSIRMIERNATGIYNAVGPAVPTTLAELVDTACAVVHSSPKLTWVSSPWLAAQPDSKTWQSPLFWSYESEWAWCVRSIRNERALAEGLTFRPVSATMADAFACYRREPAEWAAHLQCEQRVLAAWHAGTVQPKVTVDPDGTVHVPAYALPLSIYMSDAAKRAYIAERLDSPGLELSNDIVKMRETLDRVFYEPKLAKARAAYPVSIEEGDLAGVRTYAIVPKEGIAPQNEQRVLINLHSGDFRVGAGALQLIESIPLAATAKIKVISIDYRQAPEYAFPAASEDVAAVYQALLKHYEPQNIGLYGNATGGTLTAMAVAWLQQAGLPRPGAIGLISAIQATLGGDSYFTAPPLFPLFGFKFPSPPASPNGRPLAVPYLAHTDLNTPLASPILFPEVLAQFPPTLLLAGTRDFALSTVSHTHRQLIKAGIQTELHVWDGLWQHFIHDVELPESKEAYEVAARFFNRHLEKKGEKGDRPVLRKPRGEG